MSTILVAIGGSYPELQKSYSSCSSEILWEVKDEDELTKFIKEAFFQIQSFKYILLKWNGIMYLYERFHDGFTKTPIEYHPLMEKIS